MKNLKNQKGITLVALVVTIIVLLILAGVSVSLVAGSNGMMERATNAVSRSDVGTAKEQAELEIMTAITDYYDARYATTGAGKTTDPLAKYVGTKFTTAVNLTSGGTLGAASYDSANKKVTFTLTIGSNAYTADLGDDGKLASWSDPTPVE